jgi:hypothetical protein
MKKQNGFAEVNGTRLYAALHGLLMKVCDLGLPLVAVNRLKQADV